MFRKLPGGWAACNIALSIIHTSSYLTVMEWSDGMLGISSMIAVSIKNPDSVEKLKPLTFICMQPLKTNVIDVAERERWS